MITKPRGSQTTNICWQHYTGIFLLSLATLLLELALTRVLSVANWYHFGFLGDFHRTTWWRLWRDAVSMVEPARQDAPLANRRQFVYMPLYYLVLAAPFFCSGLAISLLLNRGGRAVNFLYAADLLGAGMGCAAVCVVMPAHTMSYAALAYRHQNVS